MEINVLESLEAVHETLLNCETSNSDNGLLNGSQGLALYYQQYALVFNESKFNDKAIEILNDAYTKSVSDTSNYSFGSGLTGASYMYSYFFKENQPNSIQEEINKNDQLLHRNAISLVINDSLGYADGASGILYYFAQKSNAFEMKDFISNIIEQFKMFMFQKEDAFENANKEEIVSRIGLEDGLTGTLMVLLEIYKKGIKQKVLRELIVRGVDYIIKLQQASTEQRTKLSASQLHETNYGNTLCWHNGDLCVALLLFKASSILDIPHYHTLADTITKTTLERRERKDTYVLNSNFSCGSAGLAQIYKRLYEYTNDSEYLEGYEFWIYKTLQYLAKDLRENCFVNHEHSILNGLTGVGLTLLSYISDKELNWDKALLL